jgi:putative DNA primase/helicase
MQYSFKDAIHQAGFTPPDHIKADGAIHRFTTSGDKPGSNNCWYVLHDERDFSAGAFGSWKTDISHKWSSKSESNMTSSERTQFRKNMEAIRLQREREDELRSAECRKWCESAWTDAKEATAAHTYLQRKGIQPHGVRLYKDSLIIPVKDTSGNIQGIQFIKPDGSKKFKKGTKPTAHFYGIGDGCHNNLVICEGFATGASIHEATGYDVAVAFSAGNLTAVARLFRESHPDKHIIIAGDNDQWSEGNPGVSKATKAARSINAESVYPEFTDTSTKPVDFNDLHQLEGLEAVQSQFCLTEPDKPEMDWPEPLMFGEIETPEISADLLPQPLAGFCNAVADSTQTPTGMAVMMGLSVVSTCLQKRFEVCPFGDNYTEPLNLMTVTGLDPASRKSAVVSEMTKPLSTWEMEQANALKEEAGRIWHAREMLIKSIESIKSKASKANSTDEHRRNALVEIRRLEDSMPQEVIIPRLWIDDVTPERLQNLMADNCERIAVISAEGGIFEVIAGLYSGGKSNINVILQSHAGEPVRVERQGRSVMMNKPALTFGLTVQPSIISDLATGNKARFRGNGMLARLIYCIPKSTVGNRDVTKRQPVSERIRCEYLNLINQLLAIPPLSDGPGKERPRILTLTPDALKAWLAFSQFIESRQGQYGEYHSIQDWTGKLPGAALRIAGLCHVVEHGEATAVISRPTIEKALDLAELLIVHAKAAFAMMGTDAAIPDAKNVLDWIIRNGAGRFRRNEIQSAMHGKFVRVARLIAALQVLSERHIISDEQQLLTGGRPQIFYTVNPAVLRRG